MQNITKFIFKPCSSQQEPKSSHLHSWLGRGGCGGDGTLEKQRAKIRKKEYT